MSLFLKFIFVIPIYKNLVESINYVNQLLTQEDVQLEIYLVINDGSTLQAFKDERVKIVYPGLNKGYLGSLRYIIENVNPVFDYICLSNSDLILPNNQIVKGCIESLCNEIFAVAGPDIFSTLTKSHQNPLYNQRLSDQKLKRLNIIYKYYFIYVIYQLLFYLKRILFKNEQTQRLNNPYALHGSFMIFSASFFEKGIDLNYPVFLYGEELYLAEQVLRVNLKNIYLNHISILHSEHQTSGIIKSRKSVRYLRDSVEFIRREFYGK